MPRPQSIPAAPGSAASAPDGGLWACQGWQDPATLQAALRPERGGDYLSFDPGADSAVALLVAGATRVTHVARTEAELALVALKRAAARELPLEGFRCLFGVDAAGRRVYLYHVVRGALPARARAFWDAREALIREGLLRAGRLERRIEAARPALRRARAGALGGGVALRARVRLVLSQLERVEGLDRSGLGARLASGLERLDHSPYGRWALEGAWPDEPQMPAWLQAAGHAALAGGALALASLAPSGELPALHPASFDGINLGGHPDAAALLGRAAPLLRPGGRALYWAWSPPGPPPPGLAAETAASTRLAATDGIPVYAGPCVFSA